MDIHINKVTKVVTVSLWMFQPWWLFKDSIREAMENRGIEDGDSYEVLSSRGRGRNL